MSSAPYENTAYDCAVSGHIFSVWMARSATQKYRVCVVLGCKEHETRDVPRG